MRHFISYSLKTRLNLMVLIAFLPIAGLISYNSETQEAYETGAIFQKTMLLAKAAANEEVPQLEATPKLLIPLTHVFLSFANCPKHFADLPAELPTQAKGYKDFGVLSPDGRLPATSHSQKKSFKN